MNNYALHIAGDTAIYPYYFLEIAIHIGIAHNVHFTVEMVSPEMIVCFWQPGMSEVAYNETYKRHMEDQQRALQRVRG
jgi:hypothetical protein